MKKIATIILLFLSAENFAQTNVTILLDSVITRAKQTSMYTSLVNWDSLIPIVQTKAKDAKTKEDLKPAFTTLLNGLKDKHAKVIDAKNYAYIANFTDYDNLNQPDQRPRDSKIINYINYDTSLKFETKLLLGNIGYIKIVGIGMQVDAEKESKKIRAAVISLVKKKADKFIIDLRYNGGGNMNPMVTGIATIIGEGKVGCLKNLKGEKFYDWEIKDGKYYFGGILPIVIPNQPKFKKLPKVAVLTSRYTISSGEIVATCFKGRRNTKFFGEMTGGYTTASNWEIINNEVILSISDGIYCDRNEIAYEYNIPVDQEITFEVVANLEEDKCIIEAAKWLKAK